jgi:hypothetical protein
MADDERRAEIEAMAAEAREIASVVANDAKFHRIETLIDQLEDAALDRLRDARGDDEIKRPTAWPEERT